MSAALNLAASFGDNPEEPLPDEIESALSVALPASEDRFEGAALVVARCHAAKLTQEQTADVLRRERPATALVRERFWASLPMIVAKLWADFDPLTRPRTDIGNAQRLAAEHGADIAWTPEAGGWLGWTGTRWRADDGTAVQRRAKALASLMLVEANMLLGMPNMTPEEEKTSKSRVMWANQSGNLGKIRAMIELARDEPGIAVDASAWDKKPHLLTVGNGTLELTRDGAQIREHRRGDRLTRWTPTRHRPGVYGPLWTTFLKRVLPDPDVLRYTHKLAGYTLFGGNPERLAVFPIGPTSTGKSTFVEVVGGVLGEHAGPFSLALFRSKRDEAPRPDLLDALPKRMIFTSEASDRWTLHSDEIKRLVGADSLTARTLHSKTYITGQPAFTPWIATNAAPTVTNADTALWRRLIVVPFLVTTPKHEEDPTLGARIREQESEAVLAWLIEGWNLYVAEGLDDVPAACVEAAMQLRSDLSVIDRWIADECEQDVEHVTSVDLLWRAFAMWQQDAQIDRNERVSKIQFGKELNGRGFGLTKIGPRDKRERARTGLMLTTEAALRIRHAAGHAHDPEFGGGFSIG